MGLKNGFKQTEVGVIPEDWEARRIGSVCKLVNGRGFKPFEWEKTGLPIIRIQNLNGSDEFNFFNGNYDRKLEVEPGQLLFAWSGSRGTSFGPYIWPGPLGLLNYHTWKVQNKESEVTKEFFLHALRQLTAFIEGRAHGASALVHTQKWEMEGFQFAFPPGKAEQEAIATVLSDADTFIASLERLLYKKRQLREGAMQELLTGKKRLPGFSGQWEIQELRATCVQIQDGTHFSPKLGGSDFLYVTSKNIGSGILDLSSAEKISSAEHAKIYARCAVTKGDLLLTKDGANTGNAALNTLDEPFSLLSSVAMLRFDTRKNVPAYFLYQILSPNGQRQIKEMMSGNAITRLTLVKIRSLRFPVAPLPEQTAIAGILSDMDAEIAALDAKLSKARQIKQGMMQELLTGRIRLV